MQNRLVLEEPPDGPVMAIAGEYVPALTSTEARKLIMLADSRAKGLSAGSTRRADLEIEKGRGFPIGNYTVEVFGREFDVAVCVATGEMQVAYIDRIR